MRHPAFQQCLCQLRKGHELGAWAGIRSTCTIIPGVAVSVWVRSRASQCFMSCPTQQFTAAPHMPSTTDLDPAMHPCTPEVVSSTHDATPDHAEQGGALVARCGGIHHRGLQGTAGVHPPQQACRHVSPVVYQNLASLGWHLWGLRATSVAWSPLHCLHQGLA